MEENNLVDISVETKENVNNAILPKKRGGPRTFATKSTAPKRRKLDHTPSNQNSYQTPVLDSNFDDNALPPVQRPNRSWKEDDPAYTLEDPFSHIQQSLPPHTEYEPQEINGFGPEPHDMEPLKLTPHDMGPPHPQYGLNGRDVAPLKLSGGFGAGDMNNKDLEALEEPTPQYKWIECSFCRKWRKIPAEVQDNELPNPFSCPENKWCSYYNNCGVPQEPYIEDETDVLPFTEEEMSAPLRIPEDHNLGPPHHDYNFGGFEDHHGGYYHGVPQADDWDPEDDYYKPKAPKRKRSRQSGNRSNVSLSAFLDNSEGMDPNYVKQRKEFYANLEAFLQRAPTVNLLCGSAIDLYRLYNETTARGGYEEVCAKKQWREIFRQLPQYSQTHTSASYSLKKCYRKNLLEYEQSQRHAFA